MEQTKKEEEEIDFNVGDYCYHRQIGEETLLKIERISKNIARVSVWNPFTTQFKLTTVSIDDLYKKE